MPLPAASPQAVNLADRLSSVTAAFQPHAVAQFNGHDVMVVKVLGEFCWHSHADTDDFFLVLKGRMRIETEQGVVALGEGELFVVPRGQRHRPVADSECHLLLIEPIGTPNTGNPLTAEPRRVL